jgi:hypothetical protein
MAKRTEPQIQTGDRFMKLGEPNGKIWTVVELKIATDSILHARLLATGPQSSSITIAANVLVDKRFWQSAQIE